MAKEYRISNTDKPFDDISVLEPEATYSYADYMKWNFAERIELIKGKLFKMSPAPKRVHQEISLALAMEIGIFLKGGKCKVYNAPFDVRLPKEKGLSDKETDTVVQPDVCVVCDESKLDERGCVGAPDLIIEVLSASTASKDLTNKFNLYEEHGVKGYWIVHPTEKVVEVFTLDANGRYRSEGKFGRESAIEPRTLQGLTIHLTEIFPD